MAIEQEYYGQCVSIEHINQLSTQIAELQKCQQETLNSIKIVERLLTHPFMQIEPQGPITIKAELKADADNG